MKISLGFNLQAGAYGGGNQVGWVLHDDLKRRGVEVSTDLKDPDLDLILLAEPDTSLKISAYGHHEIMHYLRHVNPRALVVHRINNTSEARDDQARTFNKYRVAANRVADHTIFISAWVHDRYVASGFASDEYTVVLNGGDPAMWTRKAAYSFTPPLKLVTHHWSTQRNKGFDIYEQLDHLLSQPEWAAKVAFTYIGRLPEGFQFKNVRFIEALSGEALRDELQRHDVYLTASQHEAAGMHHIEGALCGLPLLYRRSGALPEYCEGFGIAFDETDFVERLGDMLASYEQWVARMPAYPFTAQRMCDHYFQVFKNLIERRDELIAQRRWTACLPAIRGDQQQAIDWLQTLPDHLNRFMEALRVAPGRYLPALEGVTTEGKAIALPWSCFALKIDYMLGRWEKHSETERQQWLAFIQDFQAQGSRTVYPVGQNAFWEEALLNRVKQQRGRKARLKHLLLHPWRLTPFQRAISAETKQAIATLAQVGSGAKYPYQGFPHTPGRLRRYLHHLDWAHPWEAGAHTATIAVFLATEAPKFLSASRTATLLNICQEFLAGLADPATGAYFRGTAPGYDQLINGAMKVLTALDWLETPIHFPEKLIDTCLRQPPAAEGCHLVDAVYVLYRCQQQTHYRRPEVQRYALHLGEMLMQHFNPLDGGFSYFVGGSQVAYQGVRITQRLPVSDIHGTVLLTWAAGMLLNLLDAPQQWRIIRP